MDAAHARQWRVLAGDRDPLAPALYLADEGIKLPALADPAYIETLLKIATDRSVRMIVPTIDTELGLLSRHAAEFREHGCVAVISSPRMIEIAGDKWKTANEYAAEGIRTPRSWLPEAFDLNELPEHLFVKPRDGSASQHTYSVKRSNLLRKLSEVPNAIVQEKLLGPEVTIDGLIDFDGHPIHYVPRTRIKTIGGESVQGVTIAGDEIRDWLIRCMEVTAGFGAIGPVTLQAFLTPDGPVLTEINPRFGGGYPLTAAVGGNYPQWLLEMLDGKKFAPCFGAYKKNVYMTRYYMEHFTCEPLWDRSE